MEISEELQMRVAQIIKTGKQNALTNAAIRAAISDESVDDIVLRKAINRLRTSRTERRVLCACGSGYFWASSRAEAENYCAELHLRNMAQIRTERAVRVKTYLQYQQAGIFITPGLLEAAGFFWVAERTWHSAEYGYIVRQSSDTVNHPNTYGLFLPKQEKPVEIFQTAEQFEAWIEKQSAD